MYETILEIVILNLMSLSEWELIFFDKIPVRNFWPMNDKFTFIVCQKENKKTWPIKFICTGKDFMGTLTVLEIISAQKLKFQSAHWIFLKWPFTRTNQCSRTYPGHPGKVACLFHYVTEMRYFALGNAKGSTQYLSVRSKKLVSSLIECKKIV